MTSLKDLVEASKNTYLYKSTATQNDVGDLALFSTSFDEKSNYSGLAYVNKEHGEVVIAHRGTDFSNVKDILTDAKIVLNWKETKADMAAVRFTEKVIGDLLDRDFNINKIIFTGHSLGGREAQHCLKVLNKTSDYPLEAVTFNSARVSMDSTKGNEYDHLNLRVKGDKFLSTDLVTSFGSHLGKTIDVVLPEVKNFFQAHKLASFDLMSEHYQTAFEKTPISQLIQLFKTNTDLGILNDMSSKTKLLPNVAISADTPIVLEAQSGKKYKGEIVAESEDRYVQRLGSGSSFFATHAKDKLDDQIKVGDHVEIKYPKLDSKKALVKNIEEVHVKSKTR